MICRFIVPYIGLLALLAVISSPRSFAQAGTAQAAPAVTAPQAATADEDDGIEDTTYHWQDKRFSKDEQRQIAYIVLFLACVSAGAAWHTRRPARHFSTDGAQS